jgi:hypothetical protein
MEIIKITRGDGSIMEFEFSTPPTAAQLIAAMDGIGGRPHDRKPPSIIGNEEAGAPI